MNNEILDINEVMIHFLDGSATTEEKKTLLDWLKQSEKNRNDFSEVRDLWLLSSTVPVADDLETEVALDRLKERLVAEGPRKRGIHPLQKIMYHVVRIAAVFVALFSVGYTVYSLSSPSVTKHTVVKNRLLTADGSKGRFVLPDSTVVWLNSNTLLEYPETFTASAREVTLSGEAYFEVRRNEKLPFRVSAGDMEVEVLGTRFIVENYRRKSEVEAVLVEGSVKIEGCKMGHSVVLTPGQLLSYDKVNARTDIQIVNTADYISWIQDALTFDNSKLSDIIINLEKWYGVDIYCDAVFARSLRMSFAVKNGDSFEDILKAMTLVAPIQYNWKEDAVHIIPKKQR